VLADPLKAKQLSAVLLQDVLSMPPKSIKMMYSFKKLLVVGEFTKVHSSIL
jgi:hypothetical protein